MDETEIRFFASRAAYKYLLAICVPMVVLCIWLAFQIAIGKHAGQGFAMTLFFTLFWVAFTVKQKTEKLTFDCAGATLTRKNLFVQQTVNLRMLVRAERTVKFPMTYGPQSRPRLLLQDESGSAVVIFPGDFTMKDLETIVALLSTYIFVAKVEKNFTDLKFYVEQGMDVPRVTAWHIIRGTFLYVLLPCLLLTALLVVWAVTTKQPAFR